MLRISRFLYSDIFEAGGTGGRGGMLEGRKSFGKKGKYYIMSKYGVGLDINNHNNKF